MLVKQNSDFLFGFEATMTNCNGDPDQENKPRMDYETKTLLVSDARRKRDCRDLFKKKGYSIFVDTLADNKVPMDRMFEHIVDQWLSDPNKMNFVFKDNPVFSKLFNGTEDYKIVYQNLKKEINQNKKDTKRKKELTELNNILITEIIKRELIDIRLFGSAMAVEGVSRTFTGPVQIGWGYSLHPAELVKSNTITSIMNDDNSTFGKKYKIYYALVAHYGTINKYNAALTGMTEADRICFRKSLVQGILANQTDSKQGQSPLFYLEVIYKPEFEGYLGDLRRFIKVTYDEKRPIRSIADLSIDFSILAEVLSEMRRKNYIDEVILWQHPYAKQLNLSVIDFKPVDLWEAF
jgi:CRISPR-associated protein Csh2